LPFFAARTALVEKEEVEFVDLEVAEDTVGRASRNRNAGRRGIRKMFARAARMEETCIASRCAYLNGAAGGMQDSRDRRKFLILEVNGM
jgi:hypothetical protein